MGGLSALQYYMEPLTPVVEIPLDISTCSRGRGKERGQEGGREGGRKEGGRKREIENLSQLRSSIIPSTRGWVRI